MAFRNGSIQNARWGGVHVRVPIGSYVRAEPADLVARFGYRVSQVWPARVRLVGSLSAIGRHVDVEHRGGVFAVHYRNRAEAGKALAARLADMPTDGLVVLGLPRGGVVVAFEVASTLDVPLDVIVVRKLGAPFQPQLAMGAIGEDGLRVLNPAVLRDVSASDLAAVERRERDELGRRIRRLRGPRPPVPLAGRTALIVDDGIATGSTASAAARVARARGAARVVLAAPVASPSVIAQLREDADDVIVLDSTETLHAIGSFYNDFSQVSDDQVSQLLQRSP